jgi:hypothetical protein
MSFYSTETCRCSIYDRPYEVFKLERKQVHKQMRQARIERKLRGECGLAGCMERLRASGELLSNSMERLRLS